MDHRSHSVTAAAILMIVLAAGCASEEKAAEPSPDQVEKMRQQYIEQSKAFNAEPKPGQD